MSARAMRPRALCPVCSEHHAVSADGTLRAHPAVSDPAERTGSARRDRAVARERGRCPGSNLAPRPAAAVGR